MCSCSIVLRHRVHELLSCTQIAEACDENTIGVVAILGTTYSGHFEDVEAIDAAVGAHPPLWTAPGASEVCPISRCHRLS